MNHTPQLSKEELLQLSKENLVDALREYRDAQAELEDAQAHVEEAKESLIYARDEYESNGATEEDIDQIDDTLDYYNL